MVSAVITASAATRQMLPNHTPPYVSTARNLGPADPTQIIDVSIWLNPHNRAELDALAKDLYNPASRNYRQWLKPGEIATRFAPSAEEAATVQKFFESHNLHTVLIGPNNFYVRARGTIADVQSAFSVKLNNYEVLGKTIRANDGNPSLDAPVAALARAVSGLDTGSYSHPLTLPGLKTKGSTATASLKFTTPAPQSFTSVCFPGVKTENYTTGGTYPKATYTGLAYTGPTLTGPGCGYTPPEIWAAYNLTGLYNEGYTGTGQTIVIIDWCGSPTITQDANAFSSAYGLPALTSSNFQIIETPTPSTCAGPNTEINLDVEWSHAIAPGANIDLVVPPSGSFQDVDEATFYAVNYALGNVISGSYGSIESFTPESVLLTTDLIAEIGAISGISLNYSSGDEGDFTLYGIPPTVSSPADSPYATAVGGVTLDLSATNSIIGHTGWGNNETELTFGDFIFNPPATLGFYAGSGGGASGFFAKPAFQNGLPGPARLLPDISWLADPFTGAVIAETEPGVAPPLEWFAIGGTSLSCPMFSALWAIANQEAGVSLGQAASYVYSMPSTTIYDVVPIVPPGSIDVTATIYESSTSIFTYTPEEVMGVTYPAFTSALWDYVFEAYTTIGLSFGTDTSLMTAVGWDDVTGVGVPNAKAFADYFR
jgi:subtilase family serine protease